MGVGAVSGALSSGIGQAYGGIGDFSKELSRAFTHGIVQANISAFTGGDVGSAFLSSVISSGVGSGTNGLSKAGQLGVSALSGAGLSTAMNGGNFWEQLAYSSAVVGLNHAMQHGSLKEGRFFKNEKRAYNFMWNHAYEENVEYSAFIFDEGVLVNPSFNNDETTAQNDYYPTRNKGNLQIKYAGKWRDVKAHVHTHQRPNATFYGFSSDIDPDVQFLASMGRLRPAFIMGRDNSLHGLMYGRTGSSLISKGFWSGFTRNDLLKGNISIIKNILYK